MAKILSMQLGSVTSVQLDVLAFYRLQLGAVRGVLPNDTVPHLGLTLRYPPGSPQESIALCRLPVPAAADLANLERVSAVMLAGGTLDRDLDRTREAFQLFKNNPQCKGTALEDSLTVGVSLVEAYWKCRLWVENPKERVELPLKDSTILLLP
jgi:hypothetical protein